ncbi:MAG: PIN domain-containing protein [Nanoarchaeota archaeon]
MDEVKENSEIILNIDGNTQRIYSIKKCLDTYALIEIYLGNEKFTNYLEEDFVINDLILAEFYGVMLKNYGRNEADIWFNKLEEYSVSVDREILKEAVKFRQENKRKDLSFFDAVGYIFSLKNNYKFVTGDKEFEHMINVEFKKK